MSVANQITRIQNQVNSQTDLISQIKTALEGKVAGSGDPILQEKTVEPSTVAQTVTPDEGYDGLSKVNVESIPDEYIVPSGTKSITENGTHDVSGYASAEVNVASSGGGASVETCTLTVSGMGFEARIDATGADGSIISASKGATDTPTFSLLKNSIFQVYWMTTGVTETSGVTQIYVAGRRFFGRITEDGSVSCSGM